MAAEYTFDNRSLGKRIKELREARGITQEQLAELLSIGTNMVSCYERGVHVPSNKILALLCAYFGVTSDYLLYGISERSEDIWERIRRVPDAEKMKILVKLLFYFAEGKNSGLSGDAGLEEIKNALDRLFRDKE